MRHLLVYKLCAMVGFALENLIFAVIPLVNTNIKSNKWFWSLSNSLAGGLIIAAGLIHILPHANEFWNLSKESSDEIHDDHDDHEEHEEHEHSFPVIETTILISFILILFIDRVIFSEHSHSHKDKDDHHKIHIEHGHVHHKQFSKYPNNTEEVKQIEKVVDKKIDSAVENSQPVNQIQVKTKNNYYVAFVLLLGMSVHSVFEGLSIGITDTGTQLLGLVIAIGIHEWATSLSLGLRFRKLKISKKFHLIYSIAYCLTKPVGICIGLLFDDANNATKAIVLAISAGIFLYIATMEILCEEFNTSSMNFFKILFVFLGALAMIFFWYVEKWMNI